MYKVFRCLCGLLRLNEFEMIQILRWLRFNEFNQMMRAKIEAAEGRRFSDEEWKRMCRVQVDYKRK